MTKDNNETQFVNYLLSKLNEPELARVKESQMRIGTMLGANEKVGFFS